MAGQVGRPREFDEEEVMTKIMNRFWKYGYEGTTLSDIISVTGLQKGSLYKAFGSKQNMYNLALGLYDRTVVKGAEALLTGNRPPLERIDAFLSFPIDAAFVNNDRRGCFLCNASSGYSGASPETLEQIQRGYKKLSRGLTAALEELRPLQSRENNAARTQMLLAVYSGLRVMARTAKTKQELEQARDSAIK